VPGREQTIDSLHVSRTLFGWDKRVDQVTADDLLGAPAECTLRLHVPNSDPTVGVNRHERIACSRQDACHSRDFAVRESFYVSALSLRYIEES